MLNEDSKIIVYLRQRSLIHLPCSLLHILLHSFTFDQVEEMDSGFQATECQNICQEMEEINVSQDMEFVHNEDDLELDFVEDTPSGTVSSLISDEQTEQKASKFADLADQYRLQRSEDISQNPHVMECEKHPSWLIDHMDGIKDTLEKELIDLQDDLKDPFELNYDDTSLEQEIEEIQKMKAKEENVEQTAKLENNPIYPGSRLTVGVKN